MSDSYLFIHSFLLTQLHYQLKKEKQISEGCGIVKLIGFVPGVVVAKLAISSDIQAAVILHPGPIKEEELNGKLVLINFLVKMK